MESQMDKKLEKEISYIGIHVYKECLHWAPK